MTENLKYRKKKKKYSFWIYEDLLKMAKARAEEEMRSTSQIINRALLEFLKGK